MWRAGTRGSLLSAYVSNALDYIYNLDLQGRGFLLFPLHSIDILYSRFLTTGDMHSLWYKDPTNNLFLTAQCGVLKRVTNFIEKARHHLGIQRKLEQSLLEHWYRSRARWLVKNPLIVVPVSSYPGNYYENQWIMAEKMRTAANILYILSAIQNDHEGWGSLATNNWSTLDINHYIVFFPDMQNRAQLTGHCVPLGTSYNALTELTDASIIFNRNEWNRRTQTAKRASVCLRYLENLMLSNHATNKKKMAERISRSFDRTPHLLSPVSRISSNDFRF